MGSCSFDNGTISYVIIFGINNSSLSHSDNCKDNFEILDEGPTFGINGCFGSKGKTFSIDFSKANTNFA